MMRKGESNPAPSADTRGERGQGPQNAKERLYEKLRIPLPALDTIIAVLVVLLVAAFAAGLILGNR